MISDDTLMGTSLMTIPVQGTGWMAGQFYCSEKERSRTSCLLKPPEPFLWFSPIFAPHSGDEASGGNKAILSLQETEMYSCFLLNFQISFAKVFFFLFLYLCTFYIFRHVSIILFILCTDVYTWRNAPQKAMFTLVTAIHWFKQKKPISCPCQHRA